jgi:hypothetical protein
MDIENETAVTNTLPEPPADNKAATPPETKAANASRPAGKRGGRAPRSRKNESPRNPSTSAAAPNGRPQKAVLDEVIAYFSACGRCGYFLTGYRALVGLEALETAVNQAKSGWLVLKWNDDVRELVLKSYASDVEANDFHFEGCCMECRRHFIFRATRSANFPDSLRIEIKPRKRQ